MEYAVYTKYFKCFENALEWNRVWSGTICFYLLGEGLSFKCHSSSIIYLVDDSSYTSGILARPRPV